MVARARHRQEYSKESFFYVSEIAVKEAPVLSYMLPVIEYPPQLSNLVNIRKGVYGFGGCH